MSPRSAALRMANLGCGRRHHPDWINIDIDPGDDGAIRHDLSRSVPLADESCDVVYHSAVLEHFRRKDALKFLIECKRILRPAGMLRVGVPDLQRICELYLSKLYAALRGDVQSGREREWMVLEMLDQAVREKSGGEMLSFLRGLDGKDEGFVYSRIGQEGRELVEEMRRTEGNSMSAVQPASGGRRTPRQWAGGVRRLLRQRVLRFLLGEEGERALQVGRFRLAGEVHQWMYDRYSLSQILLEAGFVSPVCHGPSTSQIADWTTFNLDTLADGTVVKPDLLFMEVTKPERSGR